MSADNILHPRLRKFRDATAKVTEAEAAADFAFVTFMGQPTCIGCGMVFVVVREDFIDGFVFCEHPTTHHRRCPYEGEKIKVYLPVARAERV